MIFQERKYSTTFGFLLPKTQHLKQLTFIVWPVPNTIKARIAHSINGDYTI